MGEERKAPSKVTEGLNLDSTGKTVFRKNPETGEMEIYRKPGEQGAEAEPGEAPDVGEDELEE